MTARDHMSLMCELAVCDALMAQAVTGDERRAEAAILALHELGYEECASYLDTAVSFRRELSAQADESHSVRVVLHAATGRCECGAYHLPAEAFGLNRDALEKMAGE